MFTERILFYTSLALPVTLGAILGDSHPGIGKILRVIGYMTPLVYALIFPQLLVWPQIIFIILATIVSIGVSIHNEGYYRVLYGIVRYPQLVVDSTLLLINMLFSSIYFGELMLTWLFLDILVIVLILMEKGVENYGVATTYMLMAILPSDLALLTTYALISHNIGFTQALLAPISQLVSTPVPIPLPVGLIVMLGYSAKIAMFPFNPWLPIVHPEAPAHGSAILSGLIPKIGVYAIIFATRMFDMDPLVYFLLFAQGLITGFYGYFATTLQTNIKKLLAYSTVGHLGIIASLLALDKMIGGGLLDIVLLIVTYHGIAKALAFLNAGLVDQLTNTHNIYELGYVALLSPETSNVALLTAFNFIGIPPTGGFIAKASLILSSLMLIILEKQLQAIPLLLVVGAASALSVIYGAKLVGTYTSNPRRITKHPPPIPPEETWAEYFLAISSIAAPLVASLLLHVSPYIILIAIASLPALIYHLSFTNKYLRADVKYWMSGVDH